MDDLLAGLRAAGEATRLRLLHALGQSELTVSELTQILGQSQPRVSRHLKLMVEAGLLDRHREGSWVFYRLADRGPQAAFVRAIADLVPVEDPEILRDRARLAAVRETRRAQAAAYFARIAESWDLLRARHVGDQAVEAAIADLLLGTKRKRLARVIDLGTGTGRILEILSPYVDVGLGLDSSPDMVRLARARLEAIEARHIRVRQGDIYHLAADEAPADAVILHQVLHFLDDPARAIGEAARLVQPGGMLLIVDFAPHDLEDLRTHHAHRRLGFQDDEVKAWCRQAGLVTEPARALAPPVDKDQGLTVNLWLAKAVEAGPAKMRHREAAHV